MAPVIVKDDALPPGWQALYDEATNSHYYWNKATNVTTFDRPAGAGPKASQPHPQEYRENGHANGYDSRADGYDSYSNGASNAVSTASSQEYMRLHALTVQGDSAPEPFQTFEAAGFPPDIMDEIRKAGFSAPTPIQAAAWPIALSGRDVVAIAKTGSGKTCGFLLPALLHIKARRNDPRNGPTVLVLAPTRELACQIKAESDKFGRLSNIRNTCLYGGAPKGPQLRDINYGVDIVIATPGRLNDFREAGQIRLHQVTYLVLDEADRMLDMGFEPQIQKVVSSLPRQRQTLFFSATWPREVKAIASQFVVNRTVHIFVGAVEDKLVANKSITQHVQVLQRGDFYEKLQLLQGILRSKPQGSRIIIFCTTKRTCDQLARSIDREFRAAAIHGDKKQQERDWVLASFKNGSMPVMVATDVAARGLDVNNVVAVINFDFPTGVEDYVHRIGRTGRAGAKGESYTFLTQEDGKYARDLMQLMSEADQRVPPELHELAMRSRGGGIKNKWGGGGRGGGGYGGRSAYGGPPGGGYRAPGGPGAYGGPPSGPRPGYGVPSAAPYTAPAAAARPAAAPAAAAAGGAGYSAAYWANLSNGGSSKGRSRSRSRSPRRDSYKRRSRSPARRGRSRSRSPYRGARRSPSYGRYSPRR